MGQKINPKIFRLGVYDNIWKQNYIENKISENSSIFFKALHIKEYIKRILRFHGLRVQDYKINLSSTHLQIKVFYIVTPFSIYRMDKEKTFDLTKKKMLFVKIHEIKLL